MTELLEVNNLTVALPTRAGYRNAVDDLSLTVRSGEVVGIAGESGSGKTMTAMSLFGLLPHGARVSGEARLDGTNLLALRGRQLRAVRGRQVAMVSQDPSAALHPILTIGTQLTEHMRHHLGVSKAEALSRAAELLDVVRIPDPGAGAQLLSRAVLRRHAAADRDRGRARRRTAAARRRRADHRA